MPIVDPFKVTRPTASPAVSRPIVDPYRPATTPDADPIAAFDASRASATTPSTPTLTRSLPRIAGDLGLSVAQGAASLGTNLAQIPNVVTGGLVDKVLVRPLSGLVDRALGGPGTQTTLAQGAQATSDILQRGKSPLLQQREQELADTQGFLPSAKKILTDPALLSSQLAQQIPMLAGVAAPVRAIGAMAGARATGAALTRGTAKRVAGGMAEDAAQIAAKPAAARIGNTAARKAGEATVVGMSGLLGAGSAAEQAQLDVLAQPEEVWQANPEFQRMVAGGMDPQAAKESMALTAGQKAAAIAGPLSAAAGLLTRGFEQKAFTGNLPTAGFGGVLSRRGAIEAGKAVGKEAGEETIQEGSEQYAQNVGVQGVDPTRAAMAGVPEAAGTGAALGGLLGGGIHTTSALLTRAPQRFPDAKPGSLSDAGNAIPDAPTDGATPPGPPNAEATGDVPPPSATAVPPTPVSAAEIVARARDALATINAKVAAGTFEQKDIDLRNWITANIDNPEALARRAQTTLAAPEQGDLVGAAPEAAPEEAAPARLPPNVPWIDAGTGELREATDDEIKAQFATMIDNTLASGGNMKQTAASKALADWWQVPQRRLIDLRKTVLAERKAGITPETRGAAPTEPAPTEPATPANTPDPGAEAAAKMRQSAAEQAAATPLTPENPANVPQPTETPPTGGVLADGEAARVQPFDAKPGDTLEGGARVVGVHKRKKDATAEAAGSDNRRVVGFTRADGSRGWLVGEHSSPQFVGWKRASKNAVEGQTGTGRFRATETNRATMMVTDTSTGESARAAIRKGEDRNTAATRLATTLLERADTGAKLTSTPTPVKKSLTAEPVESAPADDGETAPAAGHGRPDTAAIRSAQIKRLEDRARAGTLTKDQRAELGALMKARDAEGRKRNTPAAVADFTQSDYDRVHNKPPAERTAAEVAAANAFTRKRTAAELAVRAAEEAKRQAERDDTDGFADKLPPMQRKRVTNTLNALVTMNGETDTRKAHMRRLVAAGSTVGQTGEGRALIHKGGSYTLEKHLSKTALDYADHLVNAAVDKATGEPATPPLEAAALESAAHPDNDKPDPTPAQHEAGNYKAGHIRLHGLDITIQVPKGGMRRGTDRKGKAWERAASDHYGHVRGTDGGDGEPFDVYLGPLAESPDAKVFVIRQVKPGTDTFDEYKAMIGYKTGAAARKSYQANFPRGMKVFGGIEELTLDEFKARLATTKETPNDRTTGVEPVRADDAAAEAAHSDANARPEPTIRPGGVAAVRGVGTPAPVDADGAGADGGVVATREARGQQLGRGENQRDPGTLYDQHIVQDGDGNRFMVVRARHFTVRAVPVTTGQRPETSLDTAITFNLRPGDKLDPGERSGPLYDTGKVFDLNTLAEKPAPKANVKTIVDAGTADTLHEALAKVGARVAELLAAGTKISPKTLFDLTNSLVGGTQANGAYTPRDAYDALELGVNLAIKDGVFGVMNPNGFRGASEALVQLRKLLTKLPTQSKRTSEQDEFQQFSTPPTLAFLAARAANMKPADVVLEPSAGTGDLVVMAQLAGASVVANELAPRRAALLQALGVDRVFTENAEQLDNILPDDIQPSVVLMNPPFSASAGRMGKGYRKTQIGAQHIEQALKRLAPGGRLVAIVGKGMAADRPAFRAWWNRIKKEYSVRANLGMPGKSYTKYGTQFDTQLLVIDKTGPTTGAVATNTFESAEQALATIEAIRNDAPDRAIPANRPDPQRAPAESARPEDAGETGPAGGRRKPAPVATGATRAGSGTGAGELRDPVADGGSTATDGAGGPGAGVPAADKQRRGRQPDATVRGDEDGESGAAVPAGDSGGVTVEAAEGTRESGEITDSVFEQYHPQRLRIAGAQPHPGALVQSAAMSAVEPPAPTYTPDLPADVVTKGKLSLAQLESVVYAGQAHQQQLPNGERRGYFIGDGTGVGKGREISGIVLDNMRQGRQRAVWISEKPGLLKDAQRDFAGVGGDPQLLRPQSKTKKAADIDLQKGVLFTTYATLRQGGSIDGKEVKTAGASRVDQIVKWLGDDFDGVIVFDEAHNAGNAISMKGKRGKTKPSAQALAVVDLQKKLPQARIVYVSATGATEVSNLSYTTRLGLWGEGTAFASVEGFIQGINEGGLAAMELVSRDMKAMGVYTARSLSFDGVTYGRLEHTLTPFQREVYDELATAWQGVLRRIDEALEISGAEKNTNAKAAAKAQFWGAQQRFFNQVLTAMQMPAVLTQVEKDLAAGDAVVMQIVNTYEAAQTRALADVETQDDLEALDITPRDGLIQYVKNSFPVAQYEDYVDEDGNKRCRPVKDSAGNPVLNREAVRMRDNLVTTLEQIRVPESPLDMLINHFGPDNVAEVTGRKRRVVRMQDKKTGAEKTVVQKRGSTAPEADAAEFQADKRRILVFSDAGGTGFSFHADRTAKNQRHRQHYLLQAGWRADKAVQGFGRTHRTNEASQPNYRLVTTDLPAQKRFLSSIARRLDQLGALTKGQRDTANQGLFSAKDNLESEYAQDSVTDLFVSMYRGGVEGLDFNEVTRELGFDSLIDEKNGGLNQSKLPSVPQFLNRLLSLTVTRQGEVFDAFVQRLEARVDAAIAAGTLDTGMQTLRAEKIEKVGEHLLHTDARTGAETRAVNLELTHKVKLQPFPSRSERFVRNVNSQKVWGVRALPDRTKANGEIEKVVELVGTGSRRIEPSTAIAKADKYESIETERARELWKAENEKRPKTETERRMVITGLLLPVWDRLKGDTHVVRAQTADGERLIGRLIAPNAEADTLEAFGIGVEKLGADEVMDAVMRSGKIAVLANGWQLKRVRVSGEQRLEVVSAQAYLPNVQSEITRLGGFVERIQWQQRLFLPANDTDVLAKLLENRPFRSLLQDEEDANAIGQFDTAEQSDLDAADYAIFDTPKAAAHFRAVDKAVRAVTSRWGRNAPFVHVVPTGYDLPMEAQKHPLFRPHLARGFINGNKGVVWIVAGNVKTPAEALRTLAHESVGHFGVDQIIDDHVPGGWDRLTKDIDRLRQRRLAEKKRPGGTRKALDAAKSEYGRKLDAILDSVERRYAAKDGTPANQRTFAREFIAVCAEQKLRNGLVARALAAIRAWLRKMFPGITFTSADMIELLAHSETALHIGTPRSERQAMVQALSFGRDAAVFFSALNDAVTTARGAPKKADASAWKQWLDGAQRRGEFKQAEREWLGVDAWLDSQGGPVSREDVQGFVRANGVRVEEVTLGEPPDSDVQAWWNDEGGANEETPWNELSSDERAEAADRYMDEVGRHEENGTTTKFADYQLPGGENYRELLLTLPTVGAMGGTIYEVGYSRGSVHPFNTREEAQSFIDTTMQGAKIFERPRREGEVTSWNDKRDFTSNHWDQSNILAHVRFNERTDTEGRRTLFIEEIQSDWHQAGRKRGYAPSGSPTKPWSVFNENTGAALAAFNTRAEAEADATRRGGREAGFFANPSDAYQQAGVSGASNVPDAPFKKEWPMLAFKRMLRYAAENGFDKVAWTTGDQQAARYDLSKQISEVHYSGTNLTAYDHDGKAVVKETGVMPEQLPDYIGKEAAERLLAAPKQGTLRSLSGVDLTVGGEGMRAFYDKMLPAAVNKYVKQWGAKVGETTIKTPGADLGETQGVHSIDVTAAMRTSVIDGQAMFSIGAAVRSFAEQVRDSFAKGINRGRMLDLGRTPAVLRMIGVPNLPLKMPSTVLSKLATGKRGARAPLTERQIARLPELLDDPIAVFTSATTPGAFVVLTTQMDVNGQHIVVTIAPDRRDAGNPALKVNVLTSAYGKESEWFARQAADGRMLYRDENKEAPWNRVSSGVALNRNAEPGATRPVASVMGAEDLRKFRAAASATALREETGSGDFSIAEASMDAVDDAVTDGDAGAVARAKEWMRGAYENAVPALLGALQRRHLTELMEGHRALTGAKQYDREVQQLDADRAQLMSGSPDAAEHPGDMLKRGGAQIADDLRKFAQVRGPGGWFGRQRPEAKQLADVMHQATLLGIDPSKPYERLKMQVEGNEWVDWDPQKVKARLRMYREQMMGRSGDDKRPMLDEMKRLRGLAPRERKREAAYPKMVAKYQALPEDAKRLYANVRDWHDQMSHETEKALVGRIEALGRDLMAGGKVELAKRWTRAMVQRIRAEFEANRVDGVYFPLNRTGDFWVAGTDSDGEAVYRMFESALEQQKFVKHLRARQGKVDAVGRRDGTYRAKDAPSGTFVADIIGLLKNAGASEKIQDEVYQTFLKTLPEMSMRKHQVHRKGTAGFSDDIVRGFAKNAFHGAHQLARLRHAHKMQSIVEAMQASLDNFRKGEDVEPQEVNRGDALLGELKRRHDYIMNPPDSQLANTANAVGFLYFLGATPAAALVNLTQNAQVTLPVLGAHHGWGKASRMLGAAMRDSMRTFGNIDRTLTNPEERRAYNVLRARGDIDKTRSHDLAGLAEGDRLKTSPVWAKVMEGMSFLFHRAEVMNREAAGMAAYRLARVRGDTFEQAVQYASDIINGTHFDYAAGNRPRIMQGNTMRIALQFKNYSVGMTWILYRNLHQAFRGESAEVRAVARKTLTGVLGMTALLAGTMGLPIINVIRYTAEASNALFGDDDEPWSFDVEFRQWLAENLGEEGAKWVADGAVNRTGVNLASRVSLSNLWFRDSDRELEGRDAYHARLEDLVGPIGGIGKNFYLGMERIGQGKVFRGIETMLPKFAKDAMKGYRFAAEGANSLRGDPIVEDVTTPESFIQMIGFQPTRIAEQYKVNNALKGYEQHVLNRKRSLLNAYAMAVKAGADRDVALGKIHAFNKLYPEIAIDAGTLRRSLRARARASAQAEGGVMLSKRLAPRLRDMTGVQPGA